MNNELKVGTTLSWEEVTYRISAIKLDLGDIRLEAKGGLEKTLDRHDFFNKIASGEIQIDGYRPVAIERQWTDRERAEADVRQELVTFFNGLPRDKPWPEKEALLQRFCEARGHRCPSRRTLNGYVTRYAQQGFAGLVPSFSKRGGSGWSSKVEAKEAAREALTELYMRDDKINLTQASYAVADQLKEKGITDGSRCIGRSTVRRVLLSMPKDLVKGARLDSRTYNLWSRQAVQRYEVKQPFERMEIDAKTLDLYYLDSEGNRCTGATLYAMVCARTSYPVAIYVTPGKPSEYGLLQLLQFFFRPKGEDFKQEFGIKTEWVPPCAVRTIVLDNATENASDLALNVVRQLGIQIEYARIARGDDKPHVESFFGALDKRLINLMPGATRSQDARVANRHSKAESEARYTIEDIYRYVVQYVADTYIHEPRVKQGFLYGESTSIKAAMDKSLEAFMPPPPPSKDLLERLTLVPGGVQRKVQHYGVDFKGFQFHSHELAVLLRERSISELCILHNPEDCREVFAVDPDDKTLIRLKNKTVNMPAISFDEAARLKASYSRPVVDMTGHDYQAAYAKMRAAFAADSRKRSITANNRAQRRKEKDSRHAELAGRVRPARVDALVEGFDDDVPIKPSPRRGKKT